ncbi:MAG: hypothetical protein IJ150_03735 [Bacteroidales bacterium]|nr:hypothetical protein [Bacteroidales bacterium]
MLKEYIEKKRALSNFNSSEILDTLVSYIDEKNDPECLANAMKKIHVKLYGKHFDEDCALNAVSKMFYIKAGTSAKTYGAFIPLEQSNKIFSRCKDDLKNKAYNSFDFFVTINMIYSDNYNLFKKWFKDTTEETFVNTIVTEATVNWLNDSDSPNDGTKIWSYLH